MDTTTMMNMEQHETVLKFNRSLKQTRRLIKQFCNFKSFKKGLNEHNKNE